MPTSKQIFWSLVEKSTITTSFLSVVLVTAGVYMACAEIAAPDWYIYVLLVIIGFFFGGKVQKGAMNGLNASKR